MVRCWGKTIFVGCLGWVACLSAAAEGVIPEFDFELWGRTTYGDGYVYGPPYGSTGMAVVDIDADNDYDFVLPSLSGPPQVMRNLGNDRAFYPGGPRTLDMPDPATNWYHGRYMDFDDVTGDGLPDAVVVGNNFDTDRSAVFWYENEGPREAPHFAPHTTPLYQSPQTGLAIGAVDIVDLDGDDLLDIAIAEFTMDPASEAPRVFFMRNTGTPTAPAWAAPVDLAPLSALMPLPRAVGKSEQRTPTVWQHPKQRSASAAQKSSWADVLTDLEFGDFDGDGDLDCLFYDSEVGVHWIRCLDETLLPADDNRWEDVVDLEIVPYTQSDYFQHVQGAFAVRKGPGVSPYPDFYVTVEGMLLTWRYNTRDDAYEVVQSNALAFDAGNGAPAFWDCDADGDLDMFRTETDSDAGRLLFVENVGTPYSAIWDFGTPIDSPLIDFGSADNYFRQDLYAFADADADGYTELVVQDQAARLKYYYAYAPAAGGLPSVDTAPGGYIDNAANPIVYPGITGVRPCGVAVADFNLSDDGVPEVITAYTWNMEGNDYGRVVYLAQSYSQPPTSLASWTTPYDLDLQINGSHVNFLVENLAASDVDRDGRPDLVVTLSEQYNYQICQFHVWRNTPLANNQFAFVYAGEITAPQDADPYWARLTAFADIDTDGDDDLFIGHQYTDPDEPNPEFNRYPYLHHYRNGADTGLEYWQTRVVSGQSWTFTIGDEAHNFRYVFNGSGGSIEDGVYTAGPTGQTVDIIESTDASPNWRIFIDVLPEVGVESKAIFVLGGAADDPLYPAFTQLVKNAYEALVLQGIDKANIRLFASSPIDADDDGASDTYGTATVSTLHAAVSTWAADTNRLLVYFADHGQRDRFRINAYDYLTAADYASWLNELQNRAQPPAVTTVIDMCEAGSFVEELDTPDYLQKSGITRITLTGSGTGPTEGLAMFDQTRAVSFSLPFWEQIWNGTTYGEAFTAAKVAIESINPLQVPQVDDNGNGIPNEVGDGLAAQTARPGADFDRPAPGVYIGEVAPPQVISGNSATLWLSDVVAGFPVQAAGALIVPPNLDRPLATGDDEQPVTGLVWVDFTYNETTKRWETPYSGFDIGGLYRVQYFVNILGHYHASPRIGSVDRIGVNDAWEDDDTRAVAPWLSLNSVQGHNFHQQGDVDWVWLTAPPNAHCTVAVLAQGPNCQPVVQLFRAADFETEPSPAAVDGASSPAPGQDVVFTHNFGTSEQYLLRIANANPDVYGEGTSYLLVVAAGTGGVIPPTVVVVVRENGSNKALANADVKAAGGGNTFNGKTTSTGQAEFVCTQGDTYVFEANLGGYQKGSRSVRVNNQLETVQIHLVKTTTTAVVLHLASNAAGSKVTVDGAEFDLPQDVALPAGSSHTLSVPLGAPGGLVWDRWSDSNTEATRTITLGNSDLSLTAQYKPGIRSDVNGDTKLNAVDVQLVINAVLGRPLGGYDGDVNGDKQLNAMDVQMVINAVLNRQ